MKANDDDKDYFVVYFEPTPGSIEIKTVNQSEDEADSWIEHFNGKGIPTKKMSHAEWKERYDEDPEGYEL